ACQFCAAQIFIPGLKRPIGGITGLVRHQRSSSANRCSRVQGSNPFNPEGTVEFLTPLTLNWTTLIKRMTYKINTTRSPMGTSTKARATLASSFRLSGAGATKHSRRMYIGRASSDSWSDHRGACLSTLVALNIQGYNV